MKPPGSLRNADTASWIASGAFLMPSNASFASAVKASTKPTVQDRVHSHLVERRSLTQLPYRLPLRPALETITGKCHKKQQRRAEPAIVAVSGHYKGRKHDPERVAWTLWYSQNHWHCCPGNTILFSTSFDLVVPYLEDS